MANTHAPATAKGRATRERIVQAAAELVAEKGAAGIRLDDVRSRTGASRSQLYHYFQDRNDLVRAVIDATTDAVLGNQGELLDHLDSWAGIDRWFDFMVQHQISQHRRGGCPIGSLVGRSPEKDPEARVAIGAGLDRWEAHIRNGLTRMQASGKLRKGADLAALTTATMASIQGGLLLTQVPAVARASLRISPERSAQQPPPRCRLIQPRQRRSRVGLSCQPSRRDRSTARVATASKGCPRTAGTYRAGASPPMCRRRALADASTREWES